MSTMKHPSSKPEKPKKYTDVKDYLGLPEQISELLASESDRSVILILAAYLEELLGLIVRGACVSDADAEMLLQLRRPAGDFNSKILLCTAFALIHHEEARAMKFVQNMRNHAAHFDRKGRGFDVLFDSVQTIDRVAHLAEAMNFKLVSRDPDSVRATFIISARLLSTRLAIRIAEVIRPKPPQTFKKAANELRAKMGDTPTGELIKHAEDEAGKGNLEPMSKLITAMREVVAS